MGMVPPGIVPWIRKQQETKDERPPLQGYGDQLEGYSSEETQGGQSNRALLKLMKSIEEQIALNSEIDLAEKRAQVLRMQQSGLEYSEYYMAPVSQLAEEMGIPPVPRVDYRLIGEDQR